MIDIQNLLDRYYQVVLYFYSQGKRYITESILNRNNSGFYLVNDSDNIWIKEVTGMNKKNVYLTSESVTEGHPDKLCDAIADVILEEILKQDEDSRVACEVCISKDIVFMVGEISTNADINYGKVIRNTIVRCGYDEDSKGMNGNTCKIIINLNKQSTDISRGVNRKINIGAGDQGIMFGYATNETKEYMPYSILLAHNLTRKLAEVRKNSTLSYLRPDGKSQVTVEYDEEGKPLRLDAVVLSTQHEPDVTQEQIYEDIKKHVFDAVLPQEMIDENTKFFINPTGRFVIGGPEADSGVTGRKLMVDTYGGVAHHGGGAFSGKDYTKVDRSGAYVARYIAKNIVASGIAKKCEVQLAYAIGILEPINISINSFETGIVSDEKISNIVKFVFDLSVQHVVNEFNLKKFEYSKISSYGHFGREDIELPWERLDKVEKINNVLQTLEEKSFDKH